MNKKRFKIDNDIRLKEDKVETYPISTIVDNEHKTFYFIIDDVDNVKLLVKRLNILSEQNKRLKKENMEYHHIFNCSNCRYHDYDWFDDGDEFEVCSKGNTERMMYHGFCKDWKEFE